MSELIVERGRGAPGPRHGVRIEVRAFGPWQTNGYLVWDGDSPDALVVDPGMGAADALLARVAALGLRVRRLANSHGHIDHIFDNAAVQRGTGARLAIHPDDEYRLTASNPYGLDVEPSRAGEHLRDGEQLSIGDLVFDILHTPGHTEGSVCLYEERRALLLSGDTLFPSGWGRTDLPGGDEELMVASIRRLADAIPPAVRVLPGHGEETTVARELGWMRRVADSGRLLL